ncbi:MAG: hypothetical protein IJ094_10840 [Bacilli bacterium]|nr:hypothetical protein [Bacilli bacterium]
MRKKKRYLTLTQCVEQYMSKNTNNKYWNNSKNALCGIIIANSLLQDKKPKKIKSSKSGGFGAY